MDLTALQLKFSFLKNIKISDVNLKIYEYFCSYTYDENLRILPLIINPFGITKNISGFGELNKNITLFNRLQNLNETFIEYTDNRLIKKIKILFLSTLGCLFETLKEEEKKKFLTKKKISYALKILKTLDISAIRDEVEDIFFQYLEHKTYEHYKSLRQFSANTYEQEEKNITEEMIKLFENSSINAVITSRLKSIYSIHKKILKKNILYSQVLDIIGLRILVNNKGECYLTMESILKKWPIMNNKIKDYIAVPKNNGYQSIHLSIVHHNHPVEIQIRTHEMHQNAEYGIAAHTSYKNNK